MWKLWPHETNSRHREPSCKSASLGGKLEYSSYVKSHSTSYKYVDPAINLCRQEVPVSVVDLPIAALQHVHERSVLRRGGPLHMHIINNFGAKDIFLHCISPHLRRVLLCSFLSSSSFCGCLSPHVTKRRVRFV